MRILVTGGAGFIGSALIRHLISATDHEVINLDALTYAGNLDSLDTVAHSARYRFVLGDICDASAMNQLFAEVRPQAVLHLAAESHVDRSIDAPTVCISTNVMGTAALLEAARQYWSLLPVTEQAAFRFLQVSTDEVFGDLPDTAPACTESSAYAPSSPYAASKAAADHLVRAWQRTYGLPILITHCTNNYGPCQFPEKLIPHMLLNALAGQALPLYGDGQQVRDWLHVDDHARALCRVLERAAPGSHYVIGAGQVLSNRDLVEQLCRELDVMRPLSSAEAAPARLAMQARGLPAQHYRELITQVADRPGHDRRYTIDARRLRTELDWAPREDFAQGLQQTLRWYLDHPHWWQRVLSGEYRLARRGLGQ